MTVYVLAQLRFKDRGSYERYRSRFMDVSRQFHGRLLAADENPAVLVGLWDHGKVVLMSFPDEGAFRAFHDSPDYQRIAVDRRTGADAVVLLVKGLPT